jgi:capsular exopolysaccharide synthesis family protein
VDGSGNPRSQHASDWLQPPPEQEGLNRYVATIRERIWVVLMALAIALGVVIVYLATATKMYEGQANLVITPQPAQSTSLITLPYIYQSSDPTRDVQTASGLVTNVDVADRVRAQLHSNLSSEGLLGLVKAEPVASSNFVAVTVRADSPTLARDLANAFATQAVSLQTQRLHQYVAQTLPGLRARLRAAGSAATLELQQAVTELETVGASPDPTMRVQTSATLPTAPVSPRPLLSIAGGIVGGVILGLAGAFALQVLDPRLRREEQLRRLYRLPILARIPKEQRSGTDTPLQPLSLSPAASEAYRTLRGTLAVNRRTTGDGPRAILVTGSSPSEGKTTTGINLATSLAAAGNSVILIEADLRRPSIGRALEVTPEYGVVSVLIESGELEEALVTTPTSGANLGLLLADYEGGWISELFALPAARKLIDDAKALADYVIIDSPPITDVIDALPLASYVDDVLLVVRLGKTKLSKLAQLGELLAENGIRPVGFALVGTERPARRDYAYYGARQGGPIRDVPRALARRAGVTDE